MASKTRKIHPNRGTIQNDIILGVVLLIGVYIIFNIYLYMTSNRTAEYEVRQGVIATNNIYRGLIIRDETILYADRSGNINYYVKSGSKVSVSDLIYSIDTDGSVSKEIDSVTDSDESLTGDELTELVNDIETFANSYDNQNFQSVYSYKSDLDSQLNQTLSSNALNSYEADIGLASENNTFFKGYSDKSGVIAYYIDGKEGLTTDSFTADDLVSSSYTRLNLDTQTEVNANDPVCKRVNTEAWDVIIPVSSDLANSLEDSSSIKIRFCKDNFKTTAGCSIIKKNGAYYLDLSLKTGMIRYISDRYENIELIIGETSGLKIPVSSIVEREFFTIPVSYFITSEGSSYLLVRNEDGSATEVYPTVYYKTDDYYYCDEEVLSKGDTLVLTDSQKTYTVGSQTDTLMGVYNINKGYAYFRFIDILSQNEEYAVVRSKVSYSISLYDHIALDGSSLVNNQTINQ